jgi:hypothetical protein
VEPSAAQAGALFFNVGKGRTRALLKEAGFVRGQEELRHLAPVFARHGVRLAVGPEAGGEPHDRLDRSLRRLESRLGRGAAPRSRRGATLARRSAR